MIQFLISNNSNIISSPLEQFEVVNLISINAPILGYLNISLTNLGLYSILVISIIVLMHYM
jgi:F-type H+-transporting ATPase subunit a